MTARTTTIPDPAHFRLTVKAVRNETCDAKSFVLAAERGDEARFRYQPGQFLSFRIPLGDATITRSYSLSSAPGADADMRICVKRVAGGRGSNWMNDHLRAGARIEATAPAGRFVLRGGDAPLLLIAGGSGITPCIALLKQALLQSARAVRLIYANRDAGAIIYRDELAQLQARHPGRLDCRHWLDDTNGFLTPGAIASLAQDWTGADCHICGPAPLMDMAEDTLADVMGEGAHIVTERFASPDDEPPDTSVTGTEGAAPIDRFRVTLDGTEHSVPYRAGLTLLEAAVEAGVDVPMSCTEGHCGTCMALLKSGRVEMGATRALSRRNIARGCVLACQSRPTAPDPLWLDFDL